MRAARASRPYRVGVVNTLVVLLALWCSPAGVGAQTAPADAAPERGASETREVRRADGSVIVLPPEKARPIRVPRFQTPPTIDGRLDDEAWKTAVVLTDFYQISPGDNIAPSKPTQVYLGYDARHLYMAFYCFDEPDKIRATVAQRDDVFGEDNVRVYLDTFNDQRRAYLLAFNPYGIQQDGIFTEGRGPDFTVDIVMESKGQITADGWTVEVAVPFKSLRYQAGQDKVWGFHVVRNIDRFNDELSSWLPISRDRTGTLNQAAKLVGLEQIDTERTLEIVPSLTLSETGRRVRPAAGADSANNPGLSNSGRFVNEPVKGDLGVTVKYSLSPNVTLDAAINPDFAQIEADETVVTANQRFPIFYPEKRPFFLEGVEIFQSPLQAVNTRSIIDPDVAVKLTGKRGRNTFGLMLASDNAPGSFSEDERNDPALRPRIERFLGKNATIGVLRLKRDIGRESEIGLLGTSYNFIERHNHLGGLDGRFKVDDKTVFGFQVLGTTSRRFFYDPDTNRRVYRDGHALAYQVTYDYTARHLGWFINGLGRSRDYRADVGFTRRTNTNDWTTGLRLSSEPNATATIIEKSWRNFLSADFDFQGRLQSWGTHSSFNLRLQRNTNVNVRGTVGYERLFEEEFGPKRSATQAGAFFGPDAERAAYQRGVSASFRSNPSKKFNGEISVGYSWNQFDFDFGAGRRFPRVSPAALADPKASLDPGPGRAFNLEAELELKPSESWSAELGYTRSNLTRNDTRRVAFDTHIFSWRSTYQFTRFTFVRTRIDYETLTANARGQFLFGWTPNPGTAIYAGYNDDINYNGFNPFTGAFEPQFQRNRRTFFVKLSYLLRRSF